MVGDSASVHIGLIFVVVAGLILVAPRAAISKDDLVQQHSGQGAVADDLDQILKEMAKIRRQFDKQMTAIEQRLKNLKLRHGINAESTETSPPAGQVSEPGTGVATVCREGCRFSDLNAAIKAADSGGTVTVAPGLHGSCGVIDKPIRLIGLKSPSDKRAHLAGGVCWGKAALVVAASDVVIEGFEISNVTVGDRNGACIRIDPGAGDVVVRDLYCHDSENGILGGPLKGTIIVENSTFERNGADQGQAHGLYITQGDTFILRNSQILSTKGRGHSLKSGAKRTIIEDSVIAALDGANSRAVDAFGGGEVVIRRSVIQQGMNSDNHEALGISLEARRINPEPHSTTVENNWFIFDDLSRCCRLLFRAKQFGTFTVRGNKIVAMTDMAGSSLDLEETENQFYPDRQSAKLPDYDGTVLSLPMPGAFH